MEESRSQMTNGMDQQTPVSHAAGAPEALLSAGRQIQADAHNLATHVQEAGNDLEQFICEQVQQRPYVTLGVTAGIGYVLGGGLSSRLTLVVLGMATRFGMAMAAREMGNWINQSQPTADSTEERR